MRKYTDFEVEGEPSQIAGADESERMDDSFPLAVCKHRVGNGGLTKIAIYGRI